MGTYTTVITKLTLKEDTPSEVVKMLRLLVSDDSDDWKNILAFQEEHQFSHEFFFNERWSGVFGNGTGANFCKFNWVEPLTIDCVSSIKNYSGLVDQFLNWVNPFVDQTEKALLLTIPEDRDYDRNNVAFIRFVHNVELPEMKQWLDELDLCSTVVYDEQGNRSPYSTAQSHIPEFVPVLGSITGPNVPKDNSAKDKRKKKIAAKSKRRNRK